MAEIHPNQTLVPGVQALVTRLEEQRGLIARGSDRTSRCREAVGAPTATPIQCTAEKAMLLQAIGQGVGDTQAVSKPQRQDSSTEKSVKHYRVHAKCQHKPPSLLHI